MPQETKEKLRKFNLGKHHSEETKEKCRLINTGRECNQDTRSKISNALIGRKIPKEISNKIIDTKRRNGTLKQSQETIQKRVEKNTGKKRKTGKSLLIRKNLK